MSAPIRTLDENSKNIFANKRKPRRRKILTRTQTTCVNDNDQDDNKLIESTDNYDENDENFNGKNRNRKNTSSKNTLTRSRSTIGIDVVTLVSLISSEESDSEKEDILSPIIGSPAKRAPPLRKSGKSVSFQENQGPNTTTREYNHMLRRGSIAPLAAKLRSNRPPTAPPVSIFMSDIEQSTPKMDEKSKSCIKDDDLTSNHLSDESKENSCINKNTDEETYQYPEFVKSLKERECWKLFQTMTNKGVAVSYETVLRGLLTPTELRQLLAKRKEIEMAQLRAQEIETADCCSLTIVPQQAFHVKCVSMVLNLLRVLPTRKV
ncbi:uncharacterized protein LOC129607519 [Condylostylus longicornis]|uniref:uncharacterized protein LOC129607519 n=1 Tax=Condylostylus longicornis TaxID=2530218 RepID=UPI00244DF2CD|nr:uncharacterized protein LOC129607519 [Condylostylus longicornis]